jgi:RNA polymerase sigma-54 factor
MALEQRLSPRLQQRLVMTPALQMAIKLLQLNKLELEQTLQQEMVENPMLEEREQPEVSAETEAAEADAQAGDDQLIDNLDVDSFFEKYFDSAPNTANMREQGEALPIENTLSAPPTLSDHLNWQLEMRDVAPEQLELCHAVVGNLDDHGRLRASAEEIGGMQRWPILEVERAIAVVQDLDPIGVAARDLRECLFLQLERIGAESGLAGVMVRDHLDDVTRHRFREIARATGSSMADVGAAMATIRELNPKPGQPFSTESAQYITPDVFVRKDGTEYVVTVNDDGLPRLRVSRMYRQLLKGKEGLGKETTEYLQDKMRSALWLIRSFGQRQRTIQKVSESIVAHQRAFLDHGVTALRPMVLRDVAEDIEMHESTVSRVVNGKYMHTPQGIFELRFFFHSGLGHASGSDVSSITVKEKLRRLIDAEDSRKPLSDAAVARHLKAGGLQIARRTVAKYREELGIPPSKLRREIV